MTLRSATWLAEVTEDQCRRVYGEPTWRRGQAYAVDGHVLSMDAADRGRLLLAEVAGSGRSAYQTLVTVHPDGRAGVPVWSSRCSCPVRHQCKHAAAVVALARREHAGSGPATWRDAMAALPDAVDTEPDALLVTSPLGLAVQVSSAAATPWGPHGRGVVVHPRRRTRIGSWSSTTTWAEVTAGSGMALHPDHTAAIGDLWSLHQARSLGPLTAGRSRDPVDLGPLGPAAWPVLRSALRRGVELLGMHPGDRVRLSPHDHDLVASLSRGATAPRQGGMVLTWSLDPPAADGAVLVPVGEPAHGVAAVVGDEVELLPLSRPVPARLVDLVAADPLDVPESDVPFFVSDYLPRLRESVSVRSPDGAVDLGPAPEPRLVVTLRARSVQQIDLEFGFGYPMPLEGGGTGSSGGASGMATGAGGAGAADLVVVPAHSDSGRSCGGTPRQRRSERALVAELDVLEEIPGATRADGGGARRLAASTTVTGVDAIDLVDRVVPLLRGTPGVVVRVLGELPAYHRSDEQPLVEVAGSGQDDWRTDWLDLEVAVTIDGEVVPFAPLFAALANGEAMLLLESGTWFDLDHPALLALRDLIEESRSAGAGEGTLRGGTTGGGAGDGDEVARVRLHRHQVSLWGELADLGVTSAAQGAWLRRVAAVLDHGQGAPAPVPTGLRADLRPYQRDGFTWLAALWDAGLGGILADDMGLGKTVQTLAMLLHAREVGDLTAPVLVVAPTSVLGTWAAEARRFAPDLRVAVLDATVRRRGLPVSEAVAEADLVITSYAVARIDADQFAAVSWRGLIIDEAQFVKNPAAKGHQALRRLGAPFVLVVTGTPLENSLRDLWALLALSAPGLFPSPEAFHERYRRPIERGTDPTALERLRRRVAPLMLRRRKEDVALDLPPKQIQVLSLPLHPLHRRLYDTQLQRERALILGLLDDPQANRVAILASLTRLRQLALDPTLAGSGGGTGAAAAADEAAATGAPSVKVDTLVEHLAELAQEGHRALVFSQFTRFLRRVESRLAAAGIATSYLDGGTREREAVIEGFRGGDQTAFLISLKAGGVGLTLTEADYVYVMDPWWNPAAEMQAVDRAHRIGQDKPVTVYRMVSADTVEDKVVALQERKRDLFQRVVEDGGALSAVITPEEVRALLEE